jgi:hypothetical protein
MSHHARGQRESYTRLALITAFLMCGAVPGLAQPRIDDPTCLELRWDYPADEPRLASFAIYVSQQSGSYGASPLLMVPSYGSLTLRVPCTQVAAMLPGFGLWYAVAVAQGINGEVSERSNEISFRYGSETPPPTTPPTHPPPIVPSPPLPPPPPGAYVPPPVHLPPPLTGGPGGQLTDVPIWKGISPSHPTYGIPINLPPVPSQPGRSITESCQWNGTCGR